MAIRVELNHGGVAQLLASPQVANELARRGDRVLAAAQASAPVVTGHYRDSLTLIESKTDRAVCWVASTLDYADEIEAATGNLARALDAAGGS